MKFERDATKAAGSRGLTPHRLAAARRALKKQRENCPLFAAEIADRQPTPAERIKQCDENYSTYRSRMRKFTARQWLRGRRMLRAMVLEEQQALLDFWNHEWRGPHASEYFADMVRNWHKKKQ